MTTTIEKSVEITAPIRAAYDFWANFAAYPQFMPQVQAVEQVDDTHWRWRADVAGKAVEWDAEVTENVPDQSIGWQTTSKGTRSSTTVRFATLDDGRTAVTFTAHYPNGVGKGLSAADIAQQAEENLTRFTHLLLGTAPEATDGSTAAEADAPEAEASADDTRVNADADADVTAEDDVQTPIEAVDEDLGRRPFHAASTWPFGQGRDRAASRDAAPEPQDDQSTADVLGPAYSFKPAGGAPVDAAGWLRESGLARSLDALKAFNPLLPVQAPRAVLQTPWFSSMFQVMALPFNTMKQWSEEMDRTVETFLWGASGTGRQIWAVQEAGAWLPAIDVDESEDSLKVRADLPGIADDDEVEVEVRDGQLVISGEVRHPTYADGHEPATDGPADGSDVGQGRFLRSITLPEGVDAQGAQASLHDGVLEVTLAGPSQRQRRIEVSHGQQRH